MKVTITKKAVATTIAAATTTTTSLAGADPLPKRKRVWPRETKQQQPNELRAFALLTKKVELREVP